MTPEPYKGVYAKMDFPKVPYKEYPKMLYLKERDANGQPKQLIVNSQAEELRALDEIIPVQNYDALLAEKELLEKKLAELSAQREQNAKVLEAQKTPDLKSEGPPSATIKAPQK